MHGQRFDRSDRLVPTWTRSTFLLVACLAALLVAGPAMATDVPAGFDHWVTGPGDAFHDFATSPIPPGFFYPGSNAFVGNVLLEGPGLGCGGADTTVERLAPALLPVIPSSDTVPIEIVELSLVSTAPITVTGVNPPEQWDVDVVLSPNPQPIGNMTINHTTPNGGTWDSLLPVCPLFVFNRIGPPATVFFDLCLEGFPPVQVGTLGAPWTHNVALPLQCGPPDPFASSANFLAGGPHTGPHDPDPLEEEEPEDPVPATTPWALGALGTVILGLGIAVVRRRA